VTGGVKSNDHGRNGRIFSRVAFRSRGTYKTLTFEEMSRKLIVGAMGGSAIGADL